MEPAVAMSPKYAVWPVARMGEQYSVPMNIIFGAWERIAAEGRHQIVFHDGGVYSGEDFARFLYSPGVLPVLVADTESPEIVLAAWLSGPGGGTAKAHFCSVGPFRRGAYRAVLQYWDGMMGTDGEPLFRVLVGVTPESNEPALRAVRIVGFQQVGTVPDLCDMVYEGRRVGGVVSYRQRGAQ